MIVTDSYMLVAINHFLVGFTQAPRETCCQSPIVSYIQPVMSGDMGRVVKLQQKQLTSREKYHALTKHFVPGPSCVSLGSMWKAAALLSMYLVN